MTLTPNAQQEKKHQAKLANFRTYSIATHKPRNFLIPKVDGTWDLELHNTQTKYTKVIPHDIVDHL